MKTIKPVNAITSSFGRWVIMFLVSVCSAISFTAKAQYSIVLNLAPLDGMDITSDNIFNYQVQLMEAGPVKVRVTGTISYRNSDLRIRYSYNYTLQQGLNLIRKEEINPEWTFSSQALKDLFMTHRVLPQGTYQYCVTIDRQVHSGEQVPDATLDECLFRKSEDLFLINLIYPENNAKIYEFNPMLSWMANYSFSNELTYKIRVAEIHEGQNTQNAVMRNRPVYEEKNLYQQGITYPFYAKPLVAYQPYAWTVDAYYKGILLGGAEPWRFVILEDSLLMTMIPKESSYLDVRRETSANAVFAIGTLKLKYDLQEFKTDTLKLGLREGGKEIRLKENHVTIKKGDNRVDIDFTGSPRLKHGKIYELELLNGRGEKYNVVFRYINPDFL